MTASKKQIIQEVKKASDAILHYCEIADADSLLQCYANNDDFHAFSGDGKMRNYEEFKVLSTAYYDSCEKQEISTIHEIFHVIDPSLVILGWTGNINAYFKNGDLMKMNDYSVTFIFKKIDHQWKVIHSHESSLPPEMEK